jgi:amidohydrolase
MFNRISELANKYEDEIIKLRRHFHANPEISWEEIRTTKKIVEVLNGLGFSILKTGFGGVESGVIAEITGTRDTHCIALRSDIDALPIKEETGLPFASTNNYMHACGHDSHMAMLLGAAHILAEIKDHIQGRVRLIFQPAEEHGIKSGALTMINEGALENVDAIAGLHIWSPLQTGKVSYRKGPLMASADGWYLTIQGKGGHGAMPHLSKDPTVSASKIIMALNTIISREIDSQETAVLSVGALKTNPSRFNFIPDTVTMEGTARTFNPSIQDHIEKALHRIVEGECLSSQCEGKLEYQRYYPVTINDPNLISMVINNVVTQFIGENNVEESPLVMPGEDFSFYGQHVPAAFFFLGTRNHRKGADFPHHHPKFQIDEDVLKKGSAIMAGIAYHYLIK